MRTAFRTSFERDLKKIKHDHQLLRRIRSAIESVEAASRLDQIPGVKKLRAGSGEYYGLRIGDYRIGLEMDGEVVVFNRCLHRRDIYRYFP